MTERAPHFHQSGDIPAVIGEGTEDLVCSCGQAILVKGYIPRNLLAIDLHCGACGQVTTTPGLADTENPPAAAYIPERREIPLGRPAEVGRLAALISQEEMDRLSALYLPRDPGSNPIQISLAMLDEIAADYDRITNGAMARHLDAIARAGISPGAGMREYGLAWAIHFLRTRVSDPGWSCGQDDASGVATTIAAAFRFFQLCWSHHPRFAAMEAALAGERFSPNAMARFGVAKGLSDAGNRVGFVVPEPGAARPLIGFYVAIGPDQRQDVTVEAFDRFSWPDGRQAEPVPMFNAVIERMDASRGRINPRHPGMLILSISAVWSDFDQLIANIMQAALHKHGRRYRGLTALGVILPKFRPADRPDSVHFGYNFYPFANRHHGTGGIMRAGVGGPGSRA